MKHGGFRMVTGWLRCSYMRVFPFMGAIKKAAQLSRFFYLVE